MQLAFRALLVFWIVPAAPGLAAGAPSLWLLKGLSALSLHRDNAFRAASLNRVFDASAARAPALALPGSALPLPPPPAGAATLAAPDRQRVIRLRVAAPPPPYQGTLRQLSRRPEATSRYDGMILRWAWFYGLDARLLKAVIAAESEFRRRAVSPRGALGLMQLMPETAEEMGVPRASLFDAESNIRAGAAYLAHLFARSARLFKPMTPYGVQAPLWVVRRVLAAYNAGPRMLRRSRCSAGIRAYVSKVLFFYGSDMTALSLADR